jgi:hypothetical protein
MSGHYLKSINLVDEATSVAFKLPAGNRMVCTLSIVDAVNPVLEHSIDGENWETVADITLAAGITGWNLYNTAYLPPLPLIRITADSGMTAVSIAVVE